MSQGLVTDLIIAGMLYATPIVYAALGELLTETSGVLNLGVEGMMLMGAVSAMWMTMWINIAPGFAIPLAMIVSCVVGGLFAAIHATVTITFKGNQIVSGIAITILGGSIGLSSYLAHVGNLSTRTDSLSIQSTNLFGLESLPIVGKVIFAQNPLVYLSWALVVVIHAYLYHTRLGLNLRAVGEDPRAADAMGVNVTLYRWLHTVLGGCLAGLGGACFSLVIAPRWTDGLTAGAGWIAIAIVVLAFWRPVLVLAGAYLFGIVVSLGLTLQARGVDIPGELVSAAPYIACVVVLAIVGALRRHGRLGAPSALAQPYLREEA